MTDETVETTPLPGSRLRRQRERRGLTLAQASSELHVDRRLLTALEEDDYATLGAPIFVKGHLRNYARLLGLDASELVAEYEAAQQPADPTLVAHRPDGPLMAEHRSQAWVGWFGWGFLLVLGVLLAAWWYYQQEGGADFVMSNIPERITLADEPADYSVRDPAGSELTAEPAGQTRETAASTTAPVVTDGDTGAAPSGDMSVPSTTAGAGTIEPAQQEAVPERTVQAPPATATQPAATAGKGLALEFTEESWVEIYDAEGRPILYDLLGPGTRREINASGQLRLFLGNVNGVEVYVGGERFNVERYRRSDNTARFTVNVPAAN